MAIARLEKMTRVLAGVLTFLGTTTFLSVSFSAVQAQGLSAKQDQQIREQLFERFGVDPLSLRQVQAPDQLERLAAAGPWNSVVQQNKRLVVRRPITVVAHTYFKPNEVTQTQIQHSGQISLDNKINLEEKIEFVPTVSGIQLRLLREFSPASYQYKINYAYSIDTVSGEMGDDVKFALLEAEDALLQPDERSEFWRRIGFQKELNYLSSLFVSGGTLQWPGRTSVNYGLSSSRVDGNNVIVESPQGHKDVEIPGFITYTSQDIRTARGTGKRAESWESVINSTRTYNSAPLGNKLARFFSFGIYDGQLAQEMVAAFNFTLGTKLNTSELSGKTYSDHIAEVKSLVQRLADRRNPKSQERPDGTYYGERSVFEKIAPR